MNSPAEPPAAIARPRPDVRGFIDLQVNGYAGVDFNRDPLEAHLLTAACEALSAQGVAAFLPTVISDAPELMHRRIASIASFRRSGGRAADLIAGLHIEGPFLHDADGYRGAHPREHLRPADGELMRRLLDAGEGLVRMVTLAPERDPGCRVIRLLVDRGVLVAAGHSDAGLDQLKAACDAGLTHFTHLGNGCPMLMHRHDNIIQRALSLRDRLRYTFIADGVHVPFPALGNYLALAGPERCAVVTDAMSAAGLGPGRHTLGRWSVEVGEDLAAWAPDRSHLVGSAMTMPQAFERLVGRLGLSEAEALRLVRDNPGAWLGLGL
jgi:N-acetylglucosamine-6-phosphate deacetylase